MAGLASQGHGVRRLFFEGFYWGTGRGYMLQNIDRNDAIYRSPRAELDIVVRRKLHHLLARAIKTVPYYREIGASLAGGLSEETAVVVLQQMPVLTKQIIREQGERLASGQPGEKVLWNTSGGSTGEPVRLKQDRRMRQEVTTNQLLFMKWLGFELGELHLLLWGVPLATFENGFGLRDQIYQRIHNQVYLNCYRISEEVMHSWLDYIERHRPSVIEAYADAMYGLSRMILAKGIQPAKPRGIISSAGVLLPEMRETISRAFGDCLVLNRYGSREVGDMACSCLAGPELHVSELMYFIEIVDDQGRACKPGEEGHMLITLLVNDTMPLIRYRIEDRGVWAPGPCKCGRTTKRLATVTGRQSDYLVAGDGSKVNGTALTTLLYDIGGIHNFQYVQQQQGRVILSIVPVNEQARRDLVESLHVPVKRLASLLKGAQVEVQFTDEITPSRSGKYRYIINELVDDSTHPGHQ